MGIRRSLVVALVALAAMGSALAIAARVLVSQFDAIELHETADKALQASRALEADLNQLAVSTRDYAEWDDAQAFTLMHDREFLRANFSFASLDGMQVDRMAIIDRRGEFMFVASSDEQRQSIEEQLSPTLTELARNAQRQIRTLRELPSVQRIVRTDEGLLAYSIVEITRSDHSQPSGAALFFGRFIRADEVERMRETSHLPAELIPVTSTGFDASKASVAIANGAEITGFALLSDSQGLPLAQVRVTTPREIGALGRKTTAILMGTIALLAFACCALFVFMIRRQRKHWLEQLALEARHERILSSLD